MSVFVGVIVVNTWAMVAHGPQFFFQTTFGYFIYADDVLETLFDYFIYSDGILETSYG